MHPTIQSLPSPKYAASIRRALLRWFARNQRDLPWRRDRDPYRIWVSEVMLQQTQVATVIPYFERFIRRFPTVTELAATDEQEVFQLWEGLGYYRRARHLHQAARQIVQRHKGAFPRDAYSLGELPGIGKYSVGAILSQAFDQRLPILEANSQRVLCRLFGLRGDPRRGETRRWLWQAAESLIPKRKTGDFNQALMELGALVCAPVSPHCCACPVRRGCKASEIGATHRIPPRAKGPAAVDIKEIAIIIRRRNRVLLVRRPASGRWAGLWEFPHTPIRRSESRELAVRRHAQELTGIIVTPRRELATVRHSITHHQIMLTCVEALYKTGRFRSASYDAGRWVTPQQIADYPVSSPQRRLAQILLEQHSS